MEHVQGFLRLGEKMMLLFKWIVCIMYVVEALTVLFAVVNMETDPSRATMFFAVAIYLHVSRPVMTWLAASFAKWVSDEAGRR
jgi:low temperature requirement protein LtrA